jgi:alpha/beta superfamily hydrolase
MISAEGSEERPFFFENTKTASRLFGMLYLPKEPLGIGIVFLHPIAPERITCDTIPVNIARSLASQGIVCLRFDYSGTGDSEGEFRNINKTTLFSDIEVAIATIKSVEAVKSVGLLGLRFGGMLASLYAEQANSQVEHLILCSPIIDFSSYIYNALMMSIACQPIMFGKVVATRAAFMQSLTDGHETIYEGINLRNIDGFPLTQELWMSFNSHNLLQSSGSFKNRCLVIDLCVPGKKKDLTVSELVTKYVGEVSYREISVKFLPWIHNPYLVTSIAELNECVSQWVSEGAG